MLLDIFTEVVTREIRLTVGISKKKKRFNIIAEYRHTEGLKFCIRTTTNTMEKDEFDKVVKSSIDSIVYSLILLTDKK